MSSEGQKCSRKHITAQSFKSIACQLTLDSPELLLRLELYMASGTPGALSDPAVEHSRAKKVWSSRYNELSVDGHDHLYMRSLSLSSRLSLKHKVA